MEKFHKHSLRIVKNLPHKNIHLMPAKAWEGAFYLNFHFFLFFFLSKLQILLQLKRKTLTKNNIFTIFKKDLCVVLMYVFACFVFWFLDFFLFNSISCAKEERERERMVQRYF